MFGKRELLVALLSVCCVLSAVAQKQKIDSLENILKQHRASDTVRVNILNKIAYLSYKNNSKKAKEYATQSGKLSDQLGYKKGKATSLWLTGLTYIRSDKRTSINYFQQALTLFKKINDKRGIATCLIPYASTLTDLGHSNKGDAYFKMALAIAEEIENKQIQSKCLVGISRSYTRKGMYTKAVEGLQRASTLAKDINDKPTLSVCYNNLSSIYSLQDNHPVALNYILMALKISEEQNDRSGILNNLLNIAEIKLGQKEYSEALKSAQEALKIAQELRNALRQSTSLAIIGKIYLKMNDVKALEYFEQSLAISKNNDIKQSINTLIGIGEIYCRQNSYPKALENYSKALNLAKSIGLKRAIAQAWSNMGNVFLKQKNYSQALDYTQKSLAIAKNIGLLELERDTHSQLANIYAVTNDYKNAYQHYRLYKILNDSIFNESNIKKIANLESAYKYEKEKQAHELEKQKKDIAIKKQRIIILTLVVAFILMCLLARTIYRSYKLKKRTNATLLQQKKEIEELNEEYVALNKKLKQSNEELLIAKHKIEESEERLQLLIKNSNDIFVLTNNDWESFFVSDAAKKITGYSSKELLGSSVASIHPDDKQQLEQHWEKVLTDRTAAYTVQYRHKHKQNGYVWLEAVAQNFLTHPAINAVISNIRNIDEQKKAEEAFIEREALKKKLLEMEIEKINQELEANQKAITAATLKLVQNSERDSRSVKMLEDIEKNANEEGKKNIRSLIADYKLQAYNSNWDEFELLFEKVHHSFHDKLNEQFPELTPNERKLCVFLKLNMSNKQIAQITFQSEEALKKARLRLRKKLNIDRDTNLVAFIQNI
jgi:PAS domain S-box-containing protein